MEYYLAIKKKEFLPFLMAWMNLEIVTLSEISQSERDKYYISPWIMCTHIFVCIIHYYTHGM